MTKEEILAMAKKAGYDLENGGFIREMSEMELFESFFHLAYAAGQQSSNPCQLGKCVACGNPLDQDQTKEHFVEATASEGVSPPEDSNPQRVEAPQDMIDRIADCLVEDHIDMMKEIERLRETIATLNESLRITSQGNYNASKRIVELQEQLATADETNRLLNNHLRLAEERLAKIDNLQPVAWYDPSRQEFAPHKDALHYGAAVYPLYDLGGIKK